MSGPHLVLLHAVRVTGQDQRDRGRERGRALAPKIRETSSAYAEIFGQLGIGDANHHPAVQASLAALRSWAPHQHEELGGIAEGAELDVIDLGLTVARTEILTLAEAQPGECSTLANQAPGASVSAQTWEWCSRFAGCWPLHRVAPLRGELAHAGFAEYGMPGKVGPNAAGVGVHLNIVKHRDDAPGGVPVHSVLPACRPKPPQSRTASTSSVLHPRRPPPHSRSAAPTGSPWSRSLPGASPSWDARGGWSHQPLRRGRPSGRCPAARAAVQHPRPDGLLGAGHRRQPWPPHTSDDLVPLMFSFAEEASFSYQL